MMWLSAGEMRRIDHPGLEWRSTFYVATRARPAPPQIVRVFLEDLVAVIPVG